jgi:hypothetical protein
MNPAKKNTVVVNKMLKATANIGQGPERCHTSNWRKMNIHIVK